jgi:hypothetical protein
MLVNNNNLKPLGRQTFSASSQTVNQFNKSINTNMLNLNITKNNKKLSKRFKIYKNDKEIYHHINGKVAKSLTTLIVSGNSGITALEVSSWAFRLAAYIHILRTKCDIDIITIRESHDGGIHGRYILKDKVDIIHEKIKK